MRYEQNKELDNEEFRRLTGVKRSTFNKMVEIIDEEDRRKKARSGSKSKLCIEDRLFMALEYLREYRTYFHIGRSYGMSESTTYKIIKWIEDTLVKHPDFALPGRKELLKSDMEYSDRCNRNSCGKTQKKQKRFYSGKKKKHSIKTQIIAEKKSKKIICTSFSNG